MMKTESLSSVKPLHYSLLLLFMPLNIKGLELRRIWTIESLCLALKGNSRYKKNTERTIQQHSTCRVSECTFIHALHANSIECSAQAVRVCWWFVGWRVKFRRHGLLFMALRKHAKLSLTLSVDGENAFRRSWSLFVLTNEQKCFFQGPFFSAWRLRCDQFQLHFNLRASSAPSRMFSHHHHQTATE